MEGHPLQKVRSEIESDVQAATADVETAWSAAASDTEQDELSGGFKRWTSITADTTIGRHVVTPVLSLDFPLDIGLRHTFEADFGPVD